ncbi:DNA-directed RNA polymerase, mitochondrial-like [Oppia nitens]|uniref:DNA-directed RNA polymerase, mitochondrial-like n=1 Tax=Oppia nitens TaxID=1686743 RepID=UPI0023DBA4C9|nr:DNA-directed RNA polymerase, mitochondrial-like [Oppia nitens]
MQSLIISSSSKQTNNICCHCLSRLLMIKNRWTQTTTTRQQLRSLSTKWPEATDTVIKQQPKKGGGGGGKQPNLKPKQFPRLLKDLDRFDKKLSAAAAKNLRSIGTGLTDLDIVTATEMGTDEASFDLLESSAGVSDYSLDQWLDTDLNVLAPEVEEQQLFVDDIDVDGGAAKSDTKSDKKSSKTKKQSKNSIKQEEIRRQLKDMDLMSKSSSLRYALKSYLYSCIYADMVPKAHSVLLYYRSKQLRTKRLKEMDKETLPINVSVYNIVLKGWALKGKTGKIKELFAFMKSSNVEPNTESFAYYLLSLSRQTTTTTTVTKDDIMEVINQLNNYSLSLGSLFERCCLSVDEKKAIHRLLSTIITNPKLNSLSFADRYSCKLAEEVDKIEQKFYNPCEGVDLSSLESSVEQQFALEIQGNVIIKSIAAEDTDVSENTRNFLKNQWMKTENEWRESLKQSFVTQIKGFQYQSNEINGMTLYPYLVVLDTNYYIDAIIEEIKLCANMSEYYSPPLATLFANVGKRVMLRYLVKAHIRDGTAQDFQQLYSDYIRYFQNPQMTTADNPRQYWQQLMLKNEHFYNENSRDKQWPYHVQVGVGKFLYDLIIKEVKIDVNVMKPNCKSQRKVAAFGITYKPIGNLRYQREFRAHPVVIKLHRKACLDKLVFDINMLPMLCPPTPWISPKFGGYLLNKTDFVRMPETHQKWMYNRYDRQKLYPTFDALNYLSMCPWILNNSVLDVAIHYFRNKGNKTLEIPKPLSEFPILPKIDVSMDKSDKIHVYRQRNQMKREMAEMYSLWCNCLYKLSIANHFRNKVFWFPNNMDFRGRVYPVPPHFNHLGNDLTRSLILFAKGQPLGDRGLDWLKIHLINLTGAKKRSSISERLAFANEIMPLIMDSADNPMEGCKWWQQSDEPWQTLACCMEIAKAVRSPDPKQYVCHFPVHQDGSCNGLQHYAALGRDQAGAESVNLHPADRPKDVYSDVAALVEKSRLKDAADGHEIAKLLDGYVNRKTVKQTVMTYVYGVTRFGAKLQIFKRLKETDSFPKDKAFSAAVYLAHKTFQSIGEMFTETRSIQDWFTDCARQISKVYEKPVEWVTPLGFPVVQPYHKAKTKFGETFLGIGNETTLKYLSRSDAFQKPNSLKQKNAFPPNFIHSLDSSHMMLTAMQCHRNGITFASVHDCFWTHPNCVELMNRYCRQQFIALHSEPILDELSQHFINVYGSLPTAATMSANVTKNELQKIQELMARKMKKGDFVLDNVYNSIYFFS